MPQERINISLSADGHTGRASRPSSTRSLARSLNALTNPTHVTLQSSLSLSLTLVQENNRFERTVLSFEFICNIVCQRWALARIKEGGGEEQ